MISPVIILSFRSAKSTEISHKLTPLYNTLSSLPHYYVLVLPSAETGISAYWGNFLGNAANRVWRSHKIMARLQRKGNAVST